MLRRQILPLLFFITVVLVSCSHYDELTKNPQESSTKEESHEAGENCGSCHNNNNSPGEESPGSDKWWTVSGTIFSSQNRAQKNAVIELWELPNKQGKLIKRLVSDLKGNFYTNQIVDFNGGCYVTVTVGNTTKYMAPAFTGGSCNSCHGVSSAKIIVN